MYCVEGQFLQGTWICAVCKLSYFAFFFRCRNYGIAIVAQPCTALEHLSFTKSLVAWLLSCNLAVCTLCLAIEQPAVFSPLPEGLMILYQHDRQGHRCRQEQGTGMPEWLACDAHTARTRAGKAVYSGGYGIIKECTTPHEAKSASQNETETQHHIIPPPCLKKRTMVQEKDIAHMAAHHYTLLSHHIVPPAHE